MNVLGFDTSTPATSARALRSDGESFELVPGPAELLGRPAHARELMPALAAVLGRAGLGWGEIDMVAVSRGPGSFTGIRIGVTSARALAHAHGATLRGVSSLEALAAGSSGPVTLALLDARRGELFAALYEGEDERWPPHTVAPDALLERLRGLSRPPVAVGDGSLRCRESLEASGVKVPPEDSAEHVVRALHVCRLALRAPHADGSAVVPLYLREPDARPSR